MTPRHGAPRGPRILTNRAPGLVAVAPNERRLDSRWGGAPVGRLESTVPALPELRVRRKSLPCAQTALLARVRPPSNDLMITVPDT
jgi:hypothetical protein